MCVPQMAGGMLGMAGLKPAALGGAVGLGLDSLLQKKQPAASQRYGDGSTVKGGMS